MEGAPCTPPFPPSRLPLVRRVREAGGREASPYTGALLGHALHYSPQGYPWGFLCPWVWQSSSHDRVLPPWKWIGWNRINELKVCLLSLCFFFCYQAALVPWPAGKGEQVMYLLLRPILPFSPWGTSEVRGLPSSEVTRVPGLGKG